MTILSLVLLVVAFVLFIADAVGVPQTQKVKLTPLGLAAWMLHLIVLVAAK